METRVVDSRPRGEPKLKLKSNTHVSLGLTMFTAPALLLVLSARLLLSYASGAGAEQNFRDFFLIGLWEGVLWCAVKSHDLAIPAAIGIAAKEFIEFNFTHNSFRSIISLLGIVVGAIGTDLLSGIIDTPSETKRSSSKSHHHSSSGNVRSHEREREREREKERKNSRHSRAHGPDVRFRPPRRTTSDITSVDSDSELIGPKASMSPLQREVAALRARASLADSERRRFKEEKKWAKADGNLDRAKELKWQVKRYSALMKSFHREADNKLLEAASGSRPRLPTIEEKNDTAPGTSNGHYKSRSDLPTVSVDISPSQVKSAIRVNVR